MTRRKDGGSIPPTSTVFFKYSAGHKGCGLGRRGAEGAKWARDSGAMF